MSTGSFYFWIIGLPVAVVAVSVLLAWAYQRRREELLTTTGRGAIGRVLQLSYDTDGIGGVSNYWVKVQYY